MEQRAAAARMHRDDGVEISSFEVTVGVRAPEALVQLVLEPLTGRARGDDLLREDVERWPHVGCAIEEPASHGAQDRDRFDGFVERQGIELRLGRARDAVARTPRALQERRDRARASDLEDEIDVADVDAELERSRGDERLELAVLQPLLGGETRFLREASVMAGNLVRPEFFSESRR